MRNISFQQKVVVTIGSILILLMFFFLTQELYKSFQLDQQIKSFETYNETKEEEMGSIKDKIKYFESDNYKDKYAKEILNKLRSDEKVLVILEEEENVLIPESDILKTASDKKTPQDRWKEYFFGKDKIESRIER